MNWSETEKFADAEIEISGGVVTRIIILSSGSDCDVPLPRHHVEQPSAPDILAVTRDIARGG